jgi:capsular polysaccharide biosynthesis protein/GGDEF domain-containing protein
MELRKYLTVLGRGWWIILAATVAVYLALSYFTSQQSKVYSASTTLVVSPSLSLVTDYRDILDALNSLDRRNVIVTYATVLGSDTVRQKAVDALNLDEQQQRGLKVLAQSVLEANAVQIDVEAGDAQVAADVANKIAEQAVTDLKNLYVVYDTSQLDPARPPRQPIRPDPDQVNLGVPLGLLLGTGIVLLLYYMRVPIPSLVPHLRRLARGVAARPGPANRAALSQVVSQELRRVPSRQQELAVILTRVSDIPDDSAWQVVIDSLYKYLRPNLRHRDMVMPLPDMSCLAVVLPGANQADAEHIVDQVRWRMAQNGQEPALQVAFGIASSEREKRNPDELIRRAEEAFGDAQITLAENESESQSFDGADRQDQ